MPGGRILIIDDELATLDLLKLTLTRAGFEVVTAEDGNQGLSLFREHHPNLVVVDVAMPEMSGYEVIAQIRASGDETAQTPIIVLTAFPPGVTLKDADEVGADLYLTKPITARDLTDLVDRLLARKTG